MPWLATLGYRDPTWPENDVEDEGRPLSGYHTGPHSVVQIV